MGNKAFGALATAAFLGAALQITVGLTPAKADTITFDDVTTDPQAAVPDGYRGFEWHNFLALDPSTAGGVTPSGYPTSVTSGAYSAVNINGLPASLSSASAFNFIGGNFTAAWRDDLQLAIEGYNGAILLHSITLTLSSTSVLSQVLNWTGLTEVRFSTSGGIPHAGYLLIDGGPYFAVDDLQVATTPIPGSVLLLLTGCGAIGAMGVKQRRSMKIGDPKGI